MRLYILFLIFSLFLPGCTIKIDIKYKDVGDSFKPVATEKSPIKAAIVLSETSQSKRKIRDPGNGIKEVYIMPTGEILNASLKKIVPYYFAKYSFLDSGEVAKDIDMSVVSAIEDFDIQFSSTGIASCSLSIKAILKTSFLDPNGQLLWEKPTQSEWESGNYNCFSTKAYYENLNQLTARAVVKAVDSTFKSMKTSRALTDYFKSYSGKQTVQTLPSDKPHIIFEQGWSDSEPPDDQTAKDRIRYSFEKGYINAEQLTKALKEINNQNRSKLLEVFLTGELDFVKFGELY